MTIKEARQPKCCATCGKGHYHTTARAGRTEEYKGFSVELPADYPLMECDACGEILMSPADMKYLAPVIEGAHKARITKAASKAIETLVQRESTVAAVERKLHLSNGYLSRVRNGSVEPSVHLVALLSLLANAPGSTLADLDDLVAAP